VENLIALERLKINTNTIRGKIQLFFPPTRTKG